MVVSFVYDCKCDYAGTPGNSWSVTARDATDQTASGVRVCQAKPRTICSSRVLDNFYSGAQTFTGLARHNGYLLFVHVSGIMVRGANGEA